MVDQIKHAYGFDGRCRCSTCSGSATCCTGDFGVSISTRRPVILEVTGALSNTFMLTSFAVPLAFVIGYTMGAIAGCFPGRAVDRIVTGAAVVGVSLPNYWLGIVLVIIFAVELMALPATGMGPNGSAAVQHLSLVRRAVPGAAGRHAVDDPGRHHRAHHARRGGGGAEPGLRHHTACQGAGRDRRDPPRAEELPRRRCWR